MFQSKYIAKKPDSSGWVNYSEIENRTWERLIKRQLQVVSNYACAEFLHGLDILDLPQDRIPQLSEVNQKLMASSGWQVEPVAALIPHDTFFGLLANKKFPAATFIRHPEEFDYITEPDIFHEYFGHCPMITFKPFADFMQKFGAKAAGLPEATQNLYARLYWFTVEFGLIQTNAGLKVYGGGILSSPEETRYAIDDRKPQRVTFDLEKIINTDFRIDHKQPIYFVIKNYEQLFGMDFSRVLI